MNLTTTVGFEVEFSGSTLNAVHREFRARNIATENHGRYRHSPGDIWDLKTDSSCGWEAVSPVLNTYEELVDAAFAADLIQRAGGTVTDNCGFHVHCGTANLSETQLENIFRFMTRYEQAFFLMVPEPRRNNQFCKRFPLDMVNSIKRNQFDRTDWWVRTWRDKNVWLNGRRWPDIGTIEFRLMAGTINPYFIIGYITFLQCVLATVKDRTINWGMAHSKDNRSLVQTMLGQAGFYGPFITPEQKDLYITGRKWAIERYKRANGLESSAYNTSSVVPRIPTVDVRPSWERGVQVQPQPRPRRRVRSSAADVNATMQEAVNEAIGTTDATQVTALTGAVMQAAEVIRQAQEQGEVVGEPEGPVAESAEPVVRSYRATITQPRVTEVDEWSSTPLNNMISVNSTINVNTAITSNAVGDWVVSWGPQSSQTSGQEVSNEPRQNTSGVRVTYEVINEGDEPTSPTGPVTPSTT